jgi:cysteine-S-conjugate beta-lyase
MLALEELSVAELRARPGIKWHQYADDVLGAWIAEMDFAVPEPIRAAMRRLTNGAAFGYEDPTLYPRLAASFARYMQARYAWQASTEYVLPVADLVQALFATVTAFAARGEGVVLQMPIYPPFINSVVETGRRVVEHRLADGPDGYTLEAEGLRQAIDDRTRIILLCNPHNPTGRSFSRQELTAVAAAALEHDLVVVADEVHADLIYPGGEHVPFASLGADIARRTITITSATKAYNIPGLRCGLLHFGSAQLRERFAAVFPDRLLGKVNMFGLEATIAAWDECAPWLGQVLPRLQANRDRLAAFVASELSGVRMYTPEATYLAWLDCRELQLGEVPPQAFFLEKARVALSDGTDFGAAGRGFARLNFGTSAAILEEILQRIAAAVPR